MTDGDGSAYLFLDHKKYSQREGLLGLGDSGRWGFWFHLDMT